MKTGSEVVAMDAKTRIMTIHLMDLLQKNPAFAKNLGIEVTIKEGPLQDTVIRYRVGTSRR